PGRRGGTSPSLRERRTSSWCARRRRWLRLRSRRSFLAPSLSVHPELVEGPPSTWRSAPKRGASTSSARTELGSGLEECPQRVDRGRKFVEQQVGAVGDARQLGVGQDLLPVLRLAGRDDPVGLAPDEQRRAVEALQPLPQRAVRRRDVLARGKGGARFAIPQRLP